MYGVVAAFAARLAARGVTDVVISPGSRSTALTLCLDAQPRLKTWVQLDERAAGFFALGLGRATGQPAVLVCTSGTAAANYLPAVVEASHAGVPLIVCSADRPPELRDGWGAPQTINQVGLYGAAVRWSIDLPVPSETDATTTIRWADEAVDRATGADPGPVHLNWPLREPLEPAGEVPVVAAGDAAAASSATSQTEPGSASGAAAVEVRSLAELAHRFERGVVVVGSWPGGGLRRERSWAAEAVRFAAWAGWPVIGEPISHLRGDLTGHDGLQSCVVATADHLLADRTVGDAMAPDVVVLVGRTFTTKPVRLWMERTRPRHVVLIDPENRWERAVFRLTDHVPAPIDAVRSLTERASPALRKRSIDDEPAAGGSRAGGWLHAWRNLDTAARTALGAAIDAGPLLSARVARILAGALPAGSVLVASNSMPVRDLDAFVSDTGSVLCCANRGAAGIDGTASTALGIAAADPARTVALYSGDLALLHDLGGLPAAGRLGLHLLAVCVDNDGGEIFSLLPLADRIPAADFERLFRTPHGLDLCRLDGFGGIRARRLMSAPELRDAVEAASIERRPGVDLLVVDIPRDADVAQRRSLTAAAQQAARRALAGERSARPS